MTAIELTSPAFANGDPIPDKYGYTAENVNPPLEIDGVPDETESLALAMDDPDAVEPAGKIWDHWVVWNIDPTTSTIPEDWDASGAVQGRNDYGEQGYGGPNPPDREHTYRFRLFALDQRLDLGTDTTKGQLESAMDGKVIAETQLEGTYAP
ncbi:YbhB/YbcL family Raf kinase inhibitor-like protein [Halobacteria archaeon AArc-curdl1]|uniref:YbhB/YbcL family Raf kinase inhibitor-like protein n=1 Tax=Natronosalvus hydrolyticus TaxID=2979988 RepID=A0AAP2Z6Y9_9EURY|nr:YbhB/YbcL family Raf kinase inhibitor-like protein [Halobacteria archaeon AArc-curdl1]